MYSFLQKRINQQKRIHCPPLLLISGAMEMEAMADRHRAVSEFLPYVRPDIHTASALFVKYPGKYYNNSRTGRNKLQTKNRQVRRI